VQKRLRELKTYQLTSYQRRPAPVRAFFDEETAQIIELQDLPKVWKFGEELHIPSFVSWVGQYDNGDGSPCNDSYGQVARSLSNLTFQWQPTLENGIFTCYNHQDRGNSPFGPGRCKLTVKIPQSPEDTFEWRGWEDVPQQGFGPLGGY
jgi:hypothetical protein